eukprot:m.46414 g.46414  ORF g.46414 m.46414 type:complete len:109 (-) comp12534_c0_seq1:465-791(-)
MQNVPVQYFPHHPHARPLFQLNLPEYQQLPVAGALGAAVAAAAAAGEQGVVHARDLQREQQQQPPPNNDRRTHEHDDEPLRQRQCCSGRPVASEKEQLDVVVDVSGKN